MPPASRWARSVSAQSAHNSKPDHTVLPLAEPKFEGVIGSTIKTKFEMRGGKPVIMRLPKVDFLDDKEGKPVAIQRVHRPGIGSRLWHLRWRRSALHGHRPSHRCRARLLYVLGEIAFAVFGDLLAALETKECRGISVEWWKNSGR